MVGPIHTSLPPKSGKEKLYLGDLGFDADTPAPLYLYRVEADSPLDSYHHFEQFLTKAEQEAFVDRLKVRGYINIHTSTYIRV